MGLTWQEFIGGWLGGVGGLTTSHPIDTIKVRHQDGKGSMISTIISTFKNEGPLGFYKGMAFPASMAGIQNAVYFGIYANTMRYLETKSHKSPLVPIFQAGCFASMFQCMLTTPIEIIKIKLQTQTAVKKIGSVIVPSTSMFGCIADTYRTQGVRGFYRGFLPTFIRDVPTGGLYIVIYVFFDEWFQLHKLSSYHSHMLAGGLAGSLSYAPVTPFDVVKTRLQADNPKNPKYHGTVDCIIKSYKQNGIGCFWRGFVPTFMRAFVSNATIFIIYELCLQTMY